MWKSFRIGIQTLAASATMCCSCSADACRRIPTKLWPPCAPQKGWLRRHQQNYSPNKLCRMRISPQRGAKGQFVLQVIMPPCLPISARNPRDAHCTSVLTVASCKNLVMLNTLAKKRARGRFRVGLRECKMGFGVRLQGGFRKAHLHSILRPSSNWSFTRSSGDGMMMLRLEGRRWNARMDGDTAHAQACAHVICVNFQPSLLKLQPRLSRGVGHNSICLDSCCHNSRNNDSVSLKLCKDISSRQVSDFAIGLQGHARHAPLLTPAGA